MTPFPSRFFHLALLAASLVLSAGASAQQPPPRLQPDNGPWASGAGFDFDLGKKKRKKTRQSVSGMACNLDASQRRICLLAFDEGAQARYAYVGDKSWTLDAEPVVLRDTADELDAEGAATDGRYFYVAGSHSAKRNDCASNPGSRHLIRFRLDPATGRALRSPGGALVEHADTGRLWPIMQAQAGLAPHVGERKCLGSEPPDKTPRLAGQQGVNIEGLAVQGGRLYFGFRGPVLKDTALVLAVDADALFDAQAARDPKATLTRLALGPNRGIRDMVAVKNGLLLLGRQPCQPGRGLDRGLVGRAARRRPRGAAQGAGGAGPERRQAAPMRQGTQARGHDRAGRSACGLQAAGAVGRYVRRRAAGFHAGALRASASTGLNCY